MGDARGYCVRWLAEKQRGSADLVTYFLLRAVQLSSGFGFLATNTISQGDTREVGLDQLVTTGWNIYRAAKSTPWPGQATLEIAKVWVRRDWAGLVVLDNKDVVAITTSLDPSSRLRKPHRLVGSSGKAFIGTYVLGMGFTMAPEEAQYLIQRDERNKQILFPYLNGDDLSASPRQRASRWIINFFDWPEQRARRFTDCFRIVETTIRPERTRLNQAHSTGRSRSAYWWRYAGDAKGLYLATAELDRVLVITRHSKVVLPLFVNSYQVFSDALVVFAYDSDFHFGILTSTFHWWWALTYASTLESRTRYTPTDCFETFPQPPYKDDVEVAGKALDDQRTALMLRHDEGLTKTYNRVHKPDDGSPGIPELRELHVALDLAVRDAYGWSDLDFDHDFHATPQGLRFTLGQAARAEVLDRLLELNHERYAEEVAAGLHDRKVPKKRKPPTADTPTLL